MKAEACTSPAKHSTPPSWGRRLDSVPLYLIQRFLERFDLPDKNQLILKLIGIRHFFLCPHRLRAAKAQNDIPERSVQLSATLQ